MDKELKRILANVQYMVSESAPESDIAAYLQTEGYTLQSLNDALAQAPPRPIAPMTKLADALVSFGNAAAFGLPSALSTDTRNYLEDARERGGAVRPAAIAGAVAPAIATAGGALGLTAGARALAPLRVAGPSLAARAVGAGRGVLASPLLNNRITQTAGTLATWEALKKLRDIFGGNR